MAKIKKTMANFGRLWSSLISNDVAGGNVKQYNYWLIVWQFHKKLHIHLFFHHAILFLDTYLREMKTHDRINKIYARMFTAFSYLL